MALCWWKEVAPKIASTSLLITNFHSLTSCHILTLSHNLICTTILSLSLTLFNSLKNTLRTCHVALMRGWRINQGIQSCFLTNSTLINSSMLSSSEVHRVQKERLLRNQPLKFLVIFLPNSIVFDIVGKINFSTKKSMRPSFKK
jgi:hypothetical protein